MNHPDDIPSALGHPPPAHVHEPADPRPFESGLSPTVLANPQNIDLGQPYAVPPLIEPVHADAPGLDPDPEIDEGAMIQADHALALQLAQEQQAELERNDNISYVSVDGPHTPSRFKVGKWSMKDELWDNKTIAFFNLLFLLVSLASVLVTSILAPSSSLVSSAHECQWIPRVNAAMLTLECVYFVLLALKAWLGIKGARIVRHPLYSSRRVRRIRRGANGLYYSIIGIQFTLFCFALAVAIPVSSTFETACPELPPMTLRLTLTWVALVGACMSPVAALIVMGIGYLVWLVGVAGWQWCTKRMGIPLRGHIDLSAEMEL
ncbi:hypothetical protein BCR44DRAFT_264350 [Catenaria anguillulae PL171]|uniref:Transmembrane protein n=1 Tax=Catenaria anguillulae PL171 TaxID=765915 RepID=A0A1Y2HXK7_9FUNG|nr:hypothetical protein BCR44DRAFT_264350 [Catenaria anguillulae PL171]